MKRGLLLGWLMLFASACGWAANTGRANRDLEVFASATADLLFGREQQIDYRPVTGFASAYVTEDGRCVSTAERPQYGWMREMLPRQVFTSQTNIISFCDRSRGALADFAGTFTADQRGAILFIDASGPPLPASHDELFGAQRVTEGYFGSEAAHCQLYLRHASAQRVDLAVVKLRAVDGSFDPQDASQRECVARALLRALGFVGAAELPVGQLLDGRGDLGRCRRDLRERAVCLPLIDHHYPILYLSGLRHRGLLRPGSLDRRQFLDRLYADPDAAGYAAAYRNYLALPDEPAPAPTISAH